MSDLYNILNVSRQADVKEIKKAYFDSAKVNHPDKGGDTEKFKQIQHAYDVLSDPDKKRMYDLTGNENPQDSGRGGMPFGPGGPFGGMHGMPGMPFGGMPGMPFGINVDIGSMFGNMFAGNNKRAAKRPKSPNKVHEIFLSLNDFYFGKKLRFDLERQVFCDECSGQGCVNWKTCGDCKGTCVKEVMIQLGPGMMAVNRGPCNSCNGEGRMKGSACKKCDSKGFVNTTSVLESQTKAGASVGDVLTFEGMCSDNHDFEKPGDVLIRLMKADDAEGADIVRDGASLKYDCVANLSESLMGFSRVIKSHPAHSDGLTIDIPAGTQNGEVIAISNKGMPVSGGFGDLYVKVQIKVEMTERKALETHRAILQSIFT